MKQTTNYSLNKIELADSPPDITVLNPNFDKIDTELKNLSDGKVPNTHVSTSATDSSLGHVKLSDSVSSTSGAANSVAATPSAVKSAYDKAVSVETALGTHDDVKGTSSVLGHVKLSDSTSSTSGASSGVAATPTAVKSAYDLANGKVSKSGDTMTGNLTMGADTRIECGATDNRLFLAASPSAPLGGATLQLCGEDHPQPGVFYLYANENNEQQYLVGKPNGELKWNDKHIVRSINNTRIADANGNITVPLFSGSYDDLTDKPSLDYLPLSGGSMTAATAMTRNVDTDALQLHGGTSSANGSGIWLYGKSKTDLQGVFRIRATAASENVDLIGYPNGTLKWNGANVVRSVNGVAADAAGNVAIFDSGSWDNGTTGGWWIRYKNNFQIINIAYALGHTGQDMWIPFLKPFNSTGYASVVTPNFHGTTTSYHDGITGKTTTGCTYHSMHGSGTYDISVSGIFMGWWS